MTTGITYGTAVIPHDLFAVSMSLPCKSCMHVRLLSNQDSPHLMIFYNASQLQHR